ncbi:GNAT family N-acetyltransferase [Nocardioides sp. Kera G14]|uniref:GNAT family N-acetyltransferase n=1 Tax=Nocardioides sp. Kera G14 TaxID=2884264 RepID=UPI001D0FB986|nr:GNAT family N-acetyltransferase [Nocardioides sp. Kera G14]UDY24881.1 GNAT family N-acetyltransferase [Nocardioides sp. Kera G14]
MPPVPAAEIVAVDPADPRAREAMDRYYAEIDARFPNGFDPGPHSEADDATLRPPDGVWLIAVRDGELLAGGGVRTFSGETPPYAEIKRVWVSPDARGLGLGRRMMAELERNCAELGFATARLDTNEALPEAIAMYEKTGWTRIERYNDNPYPTHFYEKRLG